jgi:hypothetical protein
MVDSLRFTADDDLDDFGYEEEQIDVTTEVGEYGSRTGSLHPHPRPPCSGCRGAAAKEAGEESRRPRQAACCGEKGGG